MIDLTPYTPQITFIIGGCIGGISHWLKKFSMGETTATLKNWYGSTNLLATIYTIIAFLFTIIGLLSGDVITAQTGIWSALYTGFVSGFAIDSGFNKAIK